MAHIIGIDLGTTNSVMAYWKRKEPRCIDNAESRTLTPSVVMSYAGQELIGDQAKDSAKADPINAIFSIKRFMGRQFQDAPVQKALSQVAYKVREAPNGEVEVQLGGHYYTPTEISAKILSKLKHDAEQSLGGEVTHAVITVPAYFTQKQKNATREAGKLAGLHVLRIITEPTAAALAYGVDAQSDDSRTILVFDMGGGTFDISIMSISGGNFDVRHIEGDNFLGGDDFDYRLVEFIMSEIKRSTGLDLRDDVKARRIVKDEAEKAKIRLSQTASISVNLADIARKPDGLPITVSFELKRERFESLIEDLVARAVDLVRKALKEAEMTPNDIDRVLLVGGSTKVPLVVRLLVDVFGNKVDTTINPMECVALGAAVQTTIPIEWTCEACHTVNDGKDEICKQCGKPQYADDNAIAYLTCEACGSINRHGRQDCWKCGAALGATILGETVTNYERTSLAIGIEEARNKNDDFGVALPFVEMIPSGVQYPTYEPFKLEMYTQQANQTYIRIPVYEGNEVLTKDNQLLETMEIEDFPPGLPIHTPITVQMSIDGDGVLTVLAYLSKQPEIKNEARIDWQGKSRQREHEKQSAAALDTNQFIYENMSRLYGHHMHDEVRSKAQTLAKQAATALKNGSTSEYEQLNEQFTALRDQVGPVEHVFFFARYYTDVAKVTTVPEQQKVQALMAQVEQNLKAENYERAQAYLDELDTLTKEFAKRVSDGRLKTSRN